MMKIEVLMSVMHQQTMLIIERTNIQTDTVIINQCDSDDYCEMLINEKKVRMYSNKERGLSRSRNRAIAASNADICLLCDDDERFYDNYPTLIEKAYKVYPKADIIVFRVKQNGKKYMERPTCVGYVQALKISSCQITFKRQSIIEKNIRFNENFGAGTKYSSGEENIFLYECLKKGLKIYYVPFEIGMVDQKQSTWFKGFTDNYFVNRGVITRYYMGVFFATIYAVYFSIAKYCNYKKDISFTKAFVKLINGIYSTKIDRPINEAKRWKI
ncbi:MAG: uncharacterized protein H6Q69_862 [Firmicutes bacterium]|nr:uncharacterized protein [Bacillota bacterium]